jgi:ubiquinone/menaquinone biosynthesis C-methylase UbiE
MKRAPLFHPVVFSDREWAEGYYQRNKTNIVRTGTRLVELLKERGFRGGKVLDVGCGFAAIPIEIARAFPEAEIIGIDLGEPLLEIGNLLIHEAGLYDRIRLQKGDALDLEFPDSTFDLTLNAYLLHIIDDPVKLCNEIERVTRPEGEIIITDLRRMWLALFLKKFQTALTTVEAESILRQTNLRKGNVVKGFFWYDWYPVERALF